MDPHVDSIVSIKKIETELLQRWSQLTFSNEFEKCYQTTSVEARFGQYSIIILVAAILFNIFYFPECLILPDVVRTAVAANVGVATLIILSALWLLQRGRIGPTVAAMIFFLAVIGSVIVVTMGSRAPNAIFMISCIPMVLVFGAALPLPFRAALVLAAVSTCAVGLACTFHPTFNFASRLFALYLTFCLTVFTLLATYNLEKSERRSYLLTLLEVHRAALLAKQNMTLQNLSETDGLTGLSNRRFFDLTLDRLWTENSTAGQSIGLLMIDIDHFKRLNDTYGHLGGDECLRAVATLIRLILRHTTNMAFRYGGEEFAVLLPDPGPGDPGKLAERIRAAIEAMDADLKSPGVDSIKITASVGYAMTMPGAKTRPATLIAIADKALYIAKRDGRNRICPPAFQDDQDDGFNPDEVDAPDQEFA